VLAAIPFVVVVLRVGLFVALCGVAVVWFRRSYFADVLETGDLGDRPGAAEDCSLTVVLSGNRGGGPKPWL